jgi:hypothetical protein
MQGDDEKAGGYYNAAPTPFLSKRPAPPKSTIQFRRTGGVNWGGMKMIRRRASSSTRRTHPVGWVERDGRDLQLRGA